ncbi:MAG TPA: ABC transporter permease [Firmicutes bacterium]|jgi:ABC-2 type transport system permease protein|nr:ABC transporter permease [Bacillota bacterium]
MAFEDLISGKLGGVIIMQQLWALIKKEFLQIRRDPRTLGMVLFAPLVMLMLYGYAVNFDIHHIAIIVCDQDCSQESREFIRGFSSSEYFDITGHDANPEHLISYLDAGIARGVLWIPRGFGRKLAEGVGSDLFFGLDGADANTATISLGYFSKYVQGYSANIIINRLTQKGRPDLVNRLTSFQTEARVWYNPELKSSHFIVPGLISTLLMMVVALLTAMAVTNEKERNTFEQLAVSPIKPWQLILGKIIPYALVSFLGVLLIIPAGVFWFGVPLRGSILVLMLFILIFLVSVLGIGLFFSTIAKTQQQAMFMVVPATTLPAILLSGFVFPIESMPHFLQWVTYLIPARFFLIALRGIFLKGVGLVVLWPQAIILLIFSTVLMVAAALKFKKRLD